MFDPNKDKKRDYNWDFSDQVETKEKRKVRSRRKGVQDIWFGLGMFGMVGWSVAIPTVIGIFLGVWIDLKWPGSYSWTLMLLVLGLLAGCYNAWYWVQKQRKSISEERENGGE
jgi:ATP synthase protein I